MTIGNTYSASERVSFTKGTNKSEAYYEGKLKQLRTKIKDYKTAMTTYTEISPEARTTQEKLDLARAKYLKLLNELNTMRSSRKRREINNNSKGLKRIEMLEPKSTIELLNELSNSKRKDSKQFTYMDDIKDKYIEKATLNYKINLLDTVIY